MKKGKQMYYMLIDGRRHEISFKVYEKLKNKSLKGLEFIKDKL